MKDFMSYNFNISKIVLAVLVPAGFGDAIHKNRSSHGIVYNVGGVKRYHFQNGSPQIVKENEILYLPKFSNYEVKSLQAGDCIAINFDVWDEQKTFDSFHFTPRNMQSLIPLFESANHYWNGRYFGYEMKCKALLYSLLYELQKGYRSMYVPTVKQNKIKKAVAYIEANYLSRNIKITELAEMSYMSPEYFRRLFGEIYITSPIKYINNLKILKAKELLSSGMFSVSEVAAMCGYEDISYFCRAFKKETSFSPTEYKGSYAGFSESALPSSDCTRTGFR